MDVKSGTQQSNMWVLSPLGATVWRRSKANSCRNNVRLTEEGNEKRAAYVCIGFSNNYINQNKLPGLGTKNIQGYGPERFLQSLLCEGQATASHKP